VTTHFNTLLLGHTERHDCYPMCCWWGMHLYDFFLDILHMRLSASLSLFASRLLTAWYRMLGSQVTNKQTSHDPLFLEPLDCNKGTTHSDTLSVFLQLQSWLLHWNVLQEDNILCELYVDTHSIFSDYSDNESLDSDSEVPTTNSHKQLWSSTGPLTPQFPHPFFLTSIKTIFIIVWE